SWSYDEALPLLRQYTDPAFTEGYRRHVGQLNLSAALIGSDNYLEAENLLAELRETAEGRADYRFIYGSILELSAQASLLMGKLSRAKSLLDEATKAIGGTDSLESVFIDKWRAVLDLRKGSRAEDALAALE